MKEKEASLVIKKVKESYNLIAQHFDLTRQENWPELKELLSSFKKGDRVLDFGCGNGRFYELIKDFEIEYFGVDISEQLLEIAKNRVPSGKFYLIKEDLSLPFSDQFFDIIVCIASLHHIPSFNLQLKVVKELYRVLKKDGFVISTVWDFYKGRNKKHLLKSFFIRLKDKIFLKNLKYSFKDIFIPWKNDKGEILAERYFYAFHMKDLKRLFRKAGFKVLALKRVSHGRSTKFSNILIIAKK